MDFFNKKNRTLIIFLFLVPVIMKIMVELMSVFINVSSAIENYIIMLPYTAVLVVLLANTYTFARQRHKWWAIIPAWLFLGLSYLLIYSSIEFIEILFF